MKEKEKIGPDRGRVARQRMTSTPLIQTTERYLGSEQEIAVAINDNLGL